MGTFNWDGEADGPPAEAYSRVSRDLDAVCADFVAWLDVLPARLEREYDCQSSIDNQAVTVSAANPAAAPLRIERIGHEGGGVVVRMWFGRAAHEWVSDCLCDACDGDSAEFIESGENIVAAVVGGLREFRRPHRADPDDILHNGPWFEEGWESAEGGGGSANADVPHDPFEIQWEPWPVRIVPAHHGAAI